jgi:hypothetical protein
MPMEKHLVTRMDSRLATPTEKRLAWDSRLALATDRLEVKAKVSATGSDCCCR